MEIIKNYQLQKTVKLLTMLVGCMLLFIAASNEKRTTIFIIGDSTAANKGGVWRCSATSTITSWSITMPSTGARR